MCLITKSSLSAARALHSSITAVSGKDITLEKLRKDNDAVFIGVGVQVSRKLGVEGEDKPGIDYGVEFLRQAADKDNPPDVSGKVVVIGGGNVAVDVARTALRLGAGSVEMVSPGAAG